MSDERSLSRELKYENEPKESSRTQKQDYLIKKSVGEFNSTLKITGERGYKHEGRHIAVLHA